MRLQPSLSDTHARLLVVLGLLGALSLALLFTSTTTAQSTPTATLTDCPSSVDEGGTFSCTVSLSEDAPSGGITVSVELDDSLSTDDQTISVLISEGEASNTFSVTLTDNDDEHDLPSVTLTIQAGTGYSVGTPSEATIDVIDDDATLPVASISASPQNVNEADNPSIIGNSKPCRNRRRRDRPVYQRLSRN